MKKKEPRLLVKIVLYALGVIVWIADCVRAMSHGHQGPGFLSFIAAAVFIAAFTVTLRRYLGSRAEENKE